MLFISAEADVMRLVAVLALCLMLLFAAEHHFGPRDGGTAPEVATVQRPDSASSTALSEGHSSAATSTSLDQSASDAADKARVNAPVEEAPERPATPNDAPNDEQRSLVFASDAALIRLLAQEKIALYVLREDRWWQVTLGELRESQRPAGPVYGLKLDTVPEVLRARAPTASGHGDAHWTVQLSTDIQAKIHRLQADGPTGLVIEGSGEVRPLNRGAAQR